MQTVKNIDSCADLLRKCMEQGFSLASISIVTRIPEQEIKQLLDNKDYSLSDKEKENCLMVFLMQLCYEKPENDQYYKALLESLTRYFKVSPQATNPYTNGIPIPLYLLMLIFSSRLRQFSFVVKVFCNVPPKGL